VERGRILARIGRGTARDERHNDAFRLFREAEIKLLDEKQSPQTGDSPWTIDELLRRRAAAKADRARRKRQPGGRARGGDPCGPAAARASHAGRAQAKPRPARGGTPRPARDPSFFTRRRHVNEAHEATHVTVPRCLGPRERRPPPSGAEPFARWPVWAKCTIWYSLADGTLGLSANVMLHHCACGARFIDHWWAKTCLACRKAALLASARAYTAERSADCKTARESRTGQCARCGELMPVGRSTRRYGADVCRQAAYRERAP
jgi:hypothetical protein